MGFDEIWQRQRAFFRTGITKSVAFRKTQLKTLGEVVTAHEAQMYEAVQRDLGKSEFETYATELSFIKNEVRFFIKNLSVLARPQEVKTNLVNQIAGSRVYYEPYGNTLVISPWNYPYQLSFVPVVSALAAGNTVILKPSEVAPHTAKVIEELVNNNFPEGLFHVVSGGVEETTELLKLQFDKIFFTGSPAVGKIVYQAAAKHMTPVTLELGGKSPVIVTRSANLKVAARRIVWGKFLNAGQSCVAPDYVYVHQEVKEIFLKELIKHIEKYRYEPGSVNYSKIINRKNFDRIVGLIDQDKVLYGGKHNAAELFIEPTIVSVSCWDEKVMQEEIFGPVLPVLTYSHLDEVFEVIRDNEKPLSAYLFTMDTKEKERFTTEISFGGGCINDTVMHLSNPDLPFGGVGNSGIGSYHGKYGFRAFSHQKAVMDKTTWGEPALKYPPYTASKMKWMKRLL
ncbi:MAG TPA: aldehyde dehydrogenase [Ginsengibacter sp.]|nr:aldehyde dehydrogenase [Ginsengibacter sp.]HRP16615.1 aldehyde dehydrogenase [Ginsengibacter sp.]